MRGLSLEELERENALLREELWDQWEANHFEHCDREWPGHEPLPVGVGGQVGPVDGDVRTNLEGAVLPFRRILSAADQREEAVSFFRLYRDLLANR